MAENDDSSAAGGGPDGEMAYNLQTLLDSQPVILSVIDPRSYTALYQNKTGTETLGDIRGKVCYKSIPKCDTVCPFCKMPEALRTGTVQSSEVKMPDGTWLLVQFSPVEKTDGTIDIVETITNITEQKAREEDHARTISVLVDREEKIDRLREQVRELGEDPVD